MKTYEQIVRQLRLVRFSDEDWVKVCDFCKNLGCKVQKYAPAKLQCSYDEFLEWYADGFGSGDFVRYGRTVCVISFKHRDSMIFCAYFDMNDKFIDLKGKLYHAKRNECSRLTSEEQAHYSYIMRNDLYRVDALHGYTYRLGNIIVGSMYNFMYFDKEYVGPAITSAKNGIIFPYRYAEDDFVVEKITIPFSDMGIKLSRPDASRIEKKIAKKYFCGWNAEKRRMDYMARRVNKGSRYYYISDKFTITATVENMSALSTGRYENGNYFTSMEEAVKFLKIVKEIRMKMVRKEK